jgi:hypothetical protein
MVWRVVALLCVLGLGQCLAGGQTSASLECDYSVKAGEPLTVRVTLDQPPSVDGTALSLYVKGPDGSELGSGLLMKPGTRVYDVPVRVPPAAVGGTWRVSLLRVAPGGRRETDLTFKECTFQIIPTPGLVLPTSADVAISASQGQLLRREATRLQARIQQVKSDVSGLEVASHKGPVTPLLRQALTDSLSALQATQEEFLKLATNNEDQRPSAEVFFEDLRKSYKDAISSLTRSTTAMPRRERLVRVSDRKRGAEPFLSLALRPMEQNELAFKVVADQGSLVFDLDVDSTPVGATVSYYRKGDSPRANPDPTRSTIRSLAYAIWIIRFEKAGYKTEEREHDPFREPNHVVHVDLQK